MRTAVVVVASTLAIALTATGASAHTLPIGYAKDKAIAKAKSYWRDQGVKPRGAYSAHACKRLSKHAVRCKTSLIGSDAYGCGEAKADVTVRFVFARSYITRATVARALFYPAYDIDATEFDPDSCIGY